MSKEKIKRDPVFWIRMGILSIFGCFILYGCGSAMFTDNPNFEGLQYVLWGIGNIIGWILAFILAFAIFIGIVALFQCSTNWLFTGNFDEW